MTLIEAVRGDLTRQHVDAVVNAANSSLLGGGGVDGAIHRAGGPAILEACEEVRRTTWPRGLPEGEAVATTAGELPARWVVHTVGPRYGRHSGYEADLLASCHRRSIEVAVEVGARSVAFPAISCGAYGWVARDAAPVAIGAVREWAATHPDATVRTVRFVLVDADAHEAFSAEVEGVTR